MADIRDETGLDGLKITIDLKRGTDPEKLMQKLFKHDRRWRTASPATSTC